MPEFRRKVDPSIVIAEQYTRENKSPKGVCGDADCEVMIYDHVHTAHDNQAVCLAVGDWVLPEPEGKGFYPVKPDIFAERYEPVSTYALGLVCRTCNLPFTFDSRDLEGFKPPCPVCGSNNKVDICDVLPPERPSGVISQELARDIWNCHNDLFKADVLLKELDKDNPRPRRADTPEDFTPSLELWLKTSSSGSSRLADVPADISFVVVEEYKKHRRERLSELMLRAAHELDRANYVRGYSDGIAAPVDMIIFCPRCNKQHVDEARPDVCELCGFSENVHTSNSHCPGFKAWLNPPHKSHRCEGCNLVFRVADIPTNGVWKIETKGENDTWAN